MMKPKILIVCKNGEVTFVGSTEPIEYCLVDYDNIDFMEEPLEEVLYEPDMVSNTGEISEAIDDNEIKKVLKVLGF